MPITSLELIRDEIEAFEQLAVNYGCSLESIRGLDAATCKWLYERVMSTEQEIATLKQAARPQTEQE